MGAFVKAATFASLVCSVLAAPIGATPAAAQTQQQKNLHWRLPKRKSPGLIARG